jgi:hypothetical protein
MDAETLHLSSDPARFRADLVNIAKTTLSSKVLSQDKDYFANLAVDAVLRLKVCPEGYHSESSASWPYARVLRTSNTYRLSKKPAESSRIRTWMKVQ